jgi:DNA-binding NarL/FixJ family response regulator
MNKKPKITVLVAEDHLIVREGLLNLLESDATIEVIGQACNGRECVEMALQLHPEVVVMDIAMPELNGLEATRQLRTAAPEIKILILSAHSDSAYVERMTELGASGYLIKQSSSQQLCTAIKEVHGGHSFYSPSITKEMERQNHTVPDRNGVQRASSVRLTKREMEVLQLIAEGYANKQIADELNISIKTVEKHRDHLMHKLDIHDTASLTRYAIAEGIIESSVQVTIEEL